MKSLTVYALAALLEIAGCFAFWACLRQNRSPWLLLAGVVSLAAFALTLTHAEPSHAGRAYAAYGGIYILSSLVWLRFVEKVAPDRWDIVGALVCVVGTLIILCGPRS